jgi:hypothetical protein
LQLLHLQVAEKPEYSGFLEAFVQQPRHAFFFGQLDQTILIKFPVQKFAEMRLLVFVRINSAGRQQYLVFDGQNKNPA